jgi:hypothetical protein
MKTKPLAVAVLLLAGAPVLLAAFARGGAAFTKRVETALLAEPKPLAAVTARIAYATRLQVEEVRGAWLRVTSGKSTGWVFAGNVAEEKPVENKGLDGLPIAASATSATAAARPLTTAATEYGERRGLAKATEDIKWLEQTSDAVGPKQVEAFLQEQKKGEFQ